MVDLQSLELVLPKTAQMAIHAVSAE